MRILHLGKHYPPTVGGMETVLQNIAEGLLDAGDEVAVVVARSADPSGSARQADLRGPLTGRPGQLVRVPVQGRWNSQPLTLDLVQVLNRMAGDFLPDLVHIHLPNPLAAAAWLAHVRLFRGRIPPLAVWHHADITRQRLGRWLVRPVIRACHASARGICVSSAALRDSSAELEPWLSRVAVIPFGIDPDPWRAVRPLRDGPFLFVGRLVPYKGLDVLLQAVARVPCAKLVIVGEGPLAGELRAKVAAGGLGGRVDLRGYVDAGAMAGLMASARALVLPSLDTSETFGLVQLEAMASGVPVLASDLPSGVGAVGVPGQTSLLFSPGDSEALAGCMARLLDEPGLAARLGAAARLRFEGHFTRGRMIADLRRWYRDLTEGRPPGDHS